MAMGGGGFSMGPDHTLLDDHLLSLATRRRGVGGLPKVLFVPTASGDPETYVDRFVESFASRAETSSLRLFYLGELEGADLRTFVLEHDVIYVGGGSTANLLALWRLHGLDEILAEALEDGIVLGGVSAGMNCWFEGSVTDSYGPLAALPDGLGFVAGSACPHYDGEVDRRPTYLELVGSEALDAGYAIQDDCALVFRDGELIEGVSERPEAQAFHVHLDGATVAEDEIDVRYLG